MAASVNTYLEDTGASVVHRFYSQASALFYQIAAHPKIGIRTPRIEDEAHEKLQKAFEDTLQETTGRRFWKSSSYGLNRCMDAMESFLSGLDLHLIQEDERWKKHRQEIAKMYQSILPIAGELRQTQGALVDGAPARLRGVASEVYRRQIRQADATTRKVLSKVIWHDKDEKILADVLWLFGKLQKPKKTLRLIFTSCDTGFVSSRGNRIIPLRILSTFGIECEWPAVTASRISAHIASLGT